MSGTGSSPIPLPQHRDHSRNWRQNAYVYPVVSRRSGGLSIGINLNPDMACNFDCIYCQVDRTVAPRVRDVDLARLGTELREMISDAADGRLWVDPAFADVPLTLRTIRDIAFSGDGEPTTCRVFRESVELAAALKREAALPDTRLVLITDACYLTRPAVVAALALLDQNNGEIWAKLDAGTEDYYRLVNRPNFPLRHVIDNIAAAARERPVVIQSLFMRVVGRPPDQREIEAYVERLREIIGTGGLIKQVQVYTIARRPADPSVTPLADAEVDAIADWVRRELGLRAVSYHGMPQSVET